MPKNGSSSVPGGGGISKAVVSAMGGPAKVREMRNAAKRDPGKLSMFRDAVRRGTRQVEMGRTGRITNRRTGTGVSQERPR